MLCMNRVAIVGAGVSGSLAALVLRSRHPTASLTVLDADVGGKLAGRHLDPTFQFIRASKTLRTVQLQSVLGMLEAEEMMARWEGRFGLLGRKGGQFLPREALANTEMGQAMRKEAEGRGSPTEGGESEGSGNLDFCGLLRPGDAPLLVGSPSNATLCASICAAAGADVRLGVRDMARRGRRGSPRATVPTRRGPCP